MSRLSGRPSGFDQRRYDDEAGNLEDSHIQGSSQESDRWRDEILWQNALDRGGKTLFA